MLNVRLMGQFDLRADGTSIDIPSCTAQSLFAFLVMHPDIPHRRAYLAGIIWPDVDESKARKYLRQALWRVRKAIGDSYIQSDRVHIKFDPKSPYNLDVEILDGQSPGSSTINDLIQAVSTYRGMLLPGFYEEWVAPERERLVVVYDYKMTQLLDTLIAAKRWSDVIFWAERWISLSHAPETAYQALITGQGEQNAIPAVIDSYRRCVQELDAVYGVSPSAETQALYKRFTVDQQGITSSVALPVEDFRRWRHNLPPQSTPFIGREENLRQIQDLIQDPECRLLTLIGPGGIGKTRLAIEIAERIVKEYEDGVYFVPLVSLQNVNQIPISIVNSINIDLRGQTDPFDQLINAIKSRRLLILLDNFEHLIQGNEIISRILKETEFLKFIITSRERLNLSAEWTFDVIGMEIPESVMIDSIDKYSAIQLFKKTAQRLQGGKSLSKAEIPHVIEICKLVDGFPLGIELAATGTRILSCQEIAEKLKVNLDILTTEAKDLPSRHRSMRVAFEHSWELLSDVEKTTLRRLSLFKGGFQMEAAQHVTGASFEVILSLSNKSLIKKKINNRLQLHESLRSYAFEKNNKHKNDLETTFIIFCDYYSNYLEKAHDLLRGEKQHGTIQNMKEENDNIDSFWDYSINNRLFQKIDKSIEGVRLFYDYQSLYHEGLTAFIKVFNILQKLENSGELNIRHNDFLGAILNILGWFSFRIGNYDAAEEYLQKSITMLESTNSVERLSSAIHSLGIVNLLLGNFSISHELVSRSLSISRKTNNKPLIAYRLNSLGMIYDAQGEYALAQEQMQRSIALFRELHDLKGLTQPINNLGLVLMRFRDFQEAKRLFLETKAILLDLNDLIGASQSSINLAWLNIEMEDFTNAISELESVLPIFSRLNNSRLNSVFFTYLGEAYVGIGRYKQGLRYILNGIRYSIRSSLFPIVLESFIRIAILYREIEQNEMSVELLSLAYHHPACAKDEQEKARILLDSLESKLPKKIYIESFNRGKRMNLVDTASRILKEGESLIDNYKM